MRSNETSKRVMRRRRRAIYLVGAGDSVQGDIAAVMRLEVDELRHVDVLGDVSADVIRDKAAAVILIDSDQNMCSPAELTAFRTSDGSTALILATRGGSRTTHQLAALARAGLDAIHIIDDLSTIEPLGRDVARYLANGLSWSVVHAVVPNAASDGERVLTLCIRRGDRASKVADIADWLQWHRKTVHRAVTRVGLRPARDLINIGRVLHAARLLDETAAPVGKVARRLHFSSISLRRLCERETGYPPRTLRDRGAMKITLATITVRRR